MESLGVAKLPLEHLVLFLQAATQANRKSHGQIARWNGRREWSWGGERLKTTLSPHQLGLLVNNFVDHHFVRNELGAAGETERARRLLRVGCGL